MPCSDCGGTRLARPGREARLGGVSLPELLALPAVELGEGLERLPGSPVAAALLPPVRQRLERMVGLGLGHLALSRASTSLSGGEAQRLRLASQLTAGLGGMLVALDERGEQHTSRQRAALMRRWLDDPGPGVGLVVGGADVVVVLDVNVDDCGCLHATDAKIHESGRAYTEPIKGDHRGNKGKSQKSTNDTIWEL